jgi:hypothetical protein
MAMTMKTWPHKDDCSAIIFYGQKMFIQQDLMPIARSVWSWCNVHAA